MMKKTMVSAMVAGSLLPGISGAAEFAHPDAVAVALQGAGRAQVCNYNTDFPKPNWICYDRVLPGAQAPVVVTLPTPGPVVVRNASWAFALEECQSGELILSSDQGPSKKWHKPSHQESTLSGEYGLCPGWVPLEPGQPMN